MKANELRINNTLLFTDKTGQDVIVTLRGINEVSGECLIQRNDNKNPIINGFLCQLEELKPVPLTEHLLTMFGFNRIDLTENGSGRAPFWRKKDKIILEEYHGESMFRVPLEGCKFTWNEYIKIIPIYYVHELQNLFFVIVDEELTLKQC